MSLSNRGTKIFYVNIVRISVLWTVTNAAVKNSRGRQNAHFLIPAFICQKTMASCNIKFRLFVGFLLQFGVLVLNTASCCTPGLNIGDLRVCSGGRSIDTVVIGVLLRVIL